MTDTKTPTVTELLSIARDLVVDAGSSWLAIEPAIARAREVLAAAVSVTAAEAVEIQIESGAWLHSSWAIDPVRARWQVATSGDLGHYVRSERHNLDPDAVEDAVAHAQDAAARAYLATGRVPAHDVEAVTSWVVA